MITNESNPSDLLKKGKLSSHRPYVNTMIILLMTFVAFMLGTLYSDEVKNQNEIQIQKHTICEPCICGSDVDSFQTMANLSHENNLNSANKNTEIEKEGTAEENCNFIASRNSNKYHRISCAWAKRIKIENRICFSSEEEAQMKGYQPAKCCNK